MVALQGQRIEVILFWCILLTSMVGSLCFGIWRVITHRMGERGNAVHIYRWLKAVIVLWILPIIFILICLYVGRSNEQKALEGLYFKNTVFESRIVLIIVVALWAIIAIGQMARYLILWIRHRQALRGLPRIMDPSWQTEADTIAKELGIRRRVDLREVPGIRSPMLVGVIRPVILLDGSIEEREARRIILYHELYHYKQRDLWWQIWMSIMVCFNWLNPLCYKLHRNLREWSEATCDALVCRKGAAEFSIKEYLHLVITYCRSTERTQNYFTRAINENGDVQSFKDRVDRLFATMDAWETGGWRYWAEPALYMMAAVVLSGLLVYTVTVLRNYAISETTPVIDQGAGKICEEFIVRPEGTDNRPSIKGALLFPNEDFSFKLDMKDGIAVCRLCPEAGKTVLDLAIFGKKDSQYEFGIFTEDGECLLGTFKGVGLTGLGLEEGRTYYIYVRDKAKTTERIHFAYYWQNQKWLEEFQSNHS